MCDPVTFIEALKALDIARRICLPGRLFRRKFCEHGEFHSPEYHVVFSCLRAEIEASSRAYPKAQYRPAVTACPRPSPNRQLGD
jgi:hypothetical protein